MAQRTNDTKQFKEEALRLVSQEGASLRQAAQDLGLKESMLQRWRTDDTELTTWPVSVNNHHSLSSLSK